jgi:predicted naringenin-chalcone synthase
MSAVIAGLGTAAPLTVPQRLTLEHAVGRCCETEEQRRVLERAYRMTGISARATILADVRESGGFFAKPQMPVIDSGPGTASRMELYSQQVPLLARQASQAALEDAKVSADSITHLVTVSCTGFFAPGFDVLLARDLKLGKNIARIHVGFMGCHGALNGLRVASSIVGAEPHARVLLCAAELCSVHFQYGWDPEQIVANSIFADGAAAVVVMDRADVLPHRPLSPIRGSGSCIVPDSLEAMTWRIGDHGFTMTLSAAVPELIRVHLKPWLDEWLQQYELDVAGVASWAVHPGGPRILTAAAEALQLPEPHLELSRKVFSQYGNMSSPTLLFVLNEMRENDMRLPCVMLGFGPGLTMEAALIA